MAELDNSKRALNKATYVPTRKQGDYIPERDGQSTGTSQSEGEHGRIRPPIREVERRLPLRVDPLRLVERVSYLRSLAIQPHEFASLREHETVKNLRLPIPGNEPTRIQGAVQDTPLLLDVAEMLVTNISPVATQENAALLASASVDDLVTLGRAVAQVRQAVADQFQAKVAEVENHYQQAQEAPAAMLNVPFGDGLRAERQYQLAQEAPAQTALLRSPAAPIQYRLTFADAAGWAQAQNLRAYKDLHLMALTHAPNPMALAEMSPQMLVRATAYSLMQSVANTNALTDGFIAGWHVEPIGRLHLERMEMTPVGIEHGELVHSVPLTPKETVNITHREWSVTTKTFEDIVQDSFEGFSETGVTDKTDLTQATENQSKHSSALDVSGSVSASYDGGSYSITASAAVDYNTQSEDLQSVKASQAHSRAITRHASERTKKEHKISFRVSSVAGTEDLAVRTLTNPSDTNAMRVDYYQLMRKWRVDLIRYGLRMTYDIVVPNPGLDLMDKVFELQVLKQQIAQPYTFSLKYSEITTANWRDYVKQYATNVEWPPKVSIPLMMSCKLEDSLDIALHDFFEFDVPDGYIVTKANFYLSAYGYWDGWKDEAKGIKNGRNPTYTILNEPGAGFNFYQAEAFEASHDLTVNSIVGRLGHVLVGWHTTNFKGGEVVLRVNMEPIPETVEAWSMRVWHQLREADKAAYQARLQLLNDRKVTLESEISQWDALTLRRMEREAIMKCVLQWLFGPTFKLMPDVVQNLLQPIDPTKMDTLVYLQTKDPSQWQTVMQYGEFIKFIHQAIEWENVIFFSYPYFWDAQHNWPFKKYLIHPDPTHRVFLRAGCARVVLTIRPGFELDFAKFIESWSPWGNEALGALPKNHPYVTIGEEIRNFAMTNYQNIPPANPDRNARPLLYPEQRKAWSDMQQWMMLLDAYKTAEGAYPEKLYDSGTLKAMESMLPYPSKDHPTITTLPSQKDPWGNDYVYTLPGIHGEYDLVSYGANGKKGIDTTQQGKQDISKTELEADITSWAEGSVVARWYEFTPTGALDIEINTKLPTTAEPA